MAWDGLRLPVDLSSKIRTHNTSHKSTAKHLKQFNYPCNLLKTPMTPWAPLWPPMV